MATTAELLIKADSSQIKTASKDLKAFSGNAGTAEKSAGKLRKSVNTMGKAFAAAALVGGSALVLLTKETLAYAKEVENLARLSGLSTEEFQRYAAGAKLVGIEQDKLSDIFKDTNDKIGDFLQTGGGALIDFFDNIAPKVGVTAEQFRNLSGPKALELYVTSLQKANVSQNEMTFFMEAIASDATGLIPLLRDNGEGFKFLGDQAQRAGAIMSEKTLDAAKNLNAVLYITNQTTKGFKNTLVEAMLPTLADLAIAFSDVSADGSVAAGVGDIIASSMKNVAKVAVGAAASVDIFGKTLGGYAAIAGSILSGDGYESIANIVAQDLEATTLKYAKFIDDIDNAGNSGNVPEVIKQLKDLFAASQNLSGGIKTGFDVTEAGKAYDVALQSIKDLNQSLLEQTDTLNMTESQTIAYRLAVGDLSDEIDLLGDVGLDYAKSIVKQAEALEMAKAAQEADTAAKDAAKSILEDLMSPMDDYVAILKEINQLEKDGYLSAGQSAEARVKAAKDFEEAQKGTAEQITTFWEEAAENIQNIMADNLFDFMQGEFEFTTDSFKKMLDKMVANALAADIAGALFGSVGANGGGGGGGLLSDLAGGLFSKLGEGDTDSFGGGFAPQSASTDFFGGLADMFSFAGGGYTGEGSRSGGLDGKGGFMAMMHPNETVIDHTKGGGGSVNININVSGVKDEGTLKQTAAQIAQRAGSAAQRAQARNG